MNREKKDSLIALIVTLVAMVAILLLLLFGAMTYTENLKPEQTASTELEVIEEEEEFIEPELESNLGEPDATTHDSPAPAIKGEPEKDVKENTRKVEPGTNPKPAPARENPVSQTKESTVKATTPSATDEEKQRVTSSMAKGFAGKNGNTDGKSDASGSGGVGVGTSGVASGRTFKGCPKPQVALSNKVTVTVSVVIDASGKVVSAHAKGGAAAYIRQACEKAALQAKWSEKADAPSTNGTITFTITPK